jgi:hypothetical protein
LLEPPVMSRQRRGEARPTFLAFSSTGRRLAQALAFKLDAVRVVNDTVEDGVGERGAADDLILLIDRHLAGDDQRARVVMILDNLQQVTTLFGRRRLRSPVIQDQ